MKLGGMVNLSGSCLYKFALSVGWAVSTNLLPQRKQPSYLKASVERKRVGPHGADEDTKL